MITRDDLRNACLPAEDVRFGKRYRLALRFSLFVSQEDEEARREPHQIHEMLVEQVYAHIYGDLMEPINELVMVAKMGARPQYYEEIRKAAKRVLDILKGEDPGGPHSSSSS